MCNERFFDAHGNLWQVATGFESDDVELRAFGPRGMAFQIPGHISQFTPEESEAGEDGWVYLKDSARPRVFACYDNGGYFNGHTVAHTAEEALQFQGLSEGVVQEVPFACPVWGGRCEKCEGHNCGPDSNAWELMNQNISRGCGYNR